MAKSRHALSHRYRHALITGASSGIGMAAAHSLIQSGIHVTGTSRFPESQNQISGIDWIQFDGSSVDGLNTFCEKNHELLINIDILINNAGSSLFGKASEIPDEILEKERCLLLGSPKRLTNKVLPYLLERQRGAIINISSLAALFKLPYMEHYSACKAELSRFTQQIMTRTQGSGVVIIDFQPGDYRTNFNRNMVRNVADDILAERVWEQMEKNLDKAPSPQRAANDIIKSMLMGKSGTIRSGSFFQSKVAPAGYWLLPDRMIHWAIRKYYRLP